MVVHVHFWWLESANWFSLSFFSLRLLLTSILLRILAHRLNFIIIHQVFDLKDFPPIYWKKILKVLRVQSNWILAVLLEKERKVPSRDEDNLCCLPNSTLTEILPESYSMGACLEDEALGLQSGHTWIQWRQNHPVLKSSICAHTEPIKDFRHYDRLIKDSHCTKEESQAKNKI